MNIDYSKHNSDRIRWVPDPSGFGFGHWEFSDAPAPKKIEVKQVMKVAKILIGKK
jgi:hypothetical protein